MQLAQFHQPGIFNYSALLLSEDGDTLYVGAREAVFAVSALNVSQKRHEVWPGLPGPAPGLRTLPVFPRSALSWPCSPPGGPHRLLSVGRGPCLPEAAFLLRVPHILTRNHLFSAGVSDVIKDNLKGAQEQRAVTDPPPSFPTSPPATPSAWL